MARQVPWGRVFAEATIIVASVLVGLGIDAWWDGRQATRQAHLELQNVVAEVRDARSEIERGLQQHQRWADATAELHDRLSTGSPGSTVDVPDTLLAGLLLPIWVTDAPTALVRAFVTSQHLGHVENEALRERLLRWVPLLEDLRDDELRVRDVHDHELRPTFLGVTDVADAWPELVSWMTGGRGIPGLELHEHTGRSITVRPSVDLRNLVAQAQILFAAPLLQSPQALDAADSLIELIVSELSGNAF